MAIDEASQQALMAKKQIRELSVKLSELEREKRLEETGKADFVGRDYDDFSPGRFQSLDAIHLRWIEPDWFEYLPSATEPFAFVRHSGDAVVPRRMFTDGGSIPSIARVFESLSPWGYAPAYLVHDWEFDLHHCRRTDKTFEDVRDTMMEAVKTLMVLGVVPESRFTFQAIDLAIGCYVARRIWDKNPENCPLPPSIN